jgi:hypothetical protein
MATPSKPWEVSQGSQGGAPSQPGQPGEAPVNGAAPVSSDVQDVIDPNDPRLVSEAVDVNVEGDAYAQPSPPPDGKYRIKLKLEGIEKADKSHLDYEHTATKKAPVMPYFHTRISATIIDPTGKYDGIKVYPEFGGYVGTLQNKDRSTKVATILARLKRPDGQPWVNSTMKMDQKGWMDLFVKALAGEPEIGGELQWQASCEQCGKEAKAAREQGKDAAYPANVNGMHRFPQEQSADKRKSAGHGYSSEVKCQKDASHGYSRAQARIVRFLHTHELK